MSRRQTNSLDGTPGRLTLRTRCTGQCLCAMGWPAVMHGACLGARRTYARGLEPGETPLRGEHVASEPGALLQVAYCTPPKTMTW